MRQLVYKVYCSRNQVPIYLWWIRPILKCWIVSLYYFCDCGLQIRWFLCFNFNLGSIRKRMLWNVLEFPNYGKQCIVLIPLSYIIKEDKWLILLQLISLLSLMEQLTACNVYQKYLANMENSFQINYQNTLMQVMSRSCVF